MLTGNHVRVRHARNRIVPAYVDPADPELLETAERLLDLFRSAVGRSRGELQEELDELFGDQPGQSVGLGLAKLLEDRSEFEVNSPHPPEALRELVFRAAGEARKLPAAFDRAAVLRAAADGLGMTPEAVERGLFADLKGEQLLATFDDLTGERLLQRYNVALAQAVLLKSTGVQVVVRDESPGRYRHLFRAVKFHRLICEAERVAEGSYRLKLDGPLSLFSATNKYGLQLALFLPHVLRCRDFELRADLRWGTERKEKLFVARPEDGLVSHLHDAANYVPPELTMFADLFRKKKSAQWEIADEATVFPLGNGVWVPDYRLTHRASGKHVYLEILGFWRRASLDKHLAMLREHCTEPYVVAVSEQFKVTDEEAAEGGPVHRFRSMPQPDEIVRLAREWVQNS